MYTIDKLNLTCPRGISYAFSNQFNNVIDLYDAIENSESVQQLVHEINEVPGHCVWNLDKDTNRYTRLITKDFIGNVFYLIVRKEN